MKSESERLDDASTAYTSASGLIDGRLATYYTTQMITPSLKESDSVLMLGLGNGQLADAMATKCRSLTVVEGSAQVIESISGSDNRYETVHALFEEYNPAKLFDVVVGTHVLEHVIDPVSVIKKSLTWVVDGGVVIFTVPNQMSLHRRIGKEMGLIPLESSLNESDVRLGHMRVYSSSELRSDLEHGNFSDIKINGYWLKMLANSAMADWDRDLLDAMFEVSKNIPTDLCADLIAVCRK